MKILVLSGVPDKPEAALVCGLQRNGFTAVFGGEPAPREMQWLAAAGVEIVPFKARARIDFGAIRQVKKLVAIHKPDIIHAFTARAVSAAVLGTLGRKVKRFAYRGVMGNISRFDPASWASFLSPSLHAISCVSNAVRESLIHGGASKEKLVTIYKGHDSTWYADSVSREERGTYGLSSSDFVIMCVANIRPGKGVDDVVSAFLALPSELPMKLVLIGSNNDDRVKKLLPHPKILELGPVPEAYKLLPLADCVVLASKREEGFPKTIIEAMIQGVPPIVTRVGGMKELVRHERDGLVIPPEDASLLRDAFLCLYNNPELRLRLGQSARERIVADFSVENTIKHTMQMYSSF